VVWWDFFNFFLAVHPKFPEKSIWVVEELNYELNRQRARVRQMDFSVPLLALPWTVVHEINKNSPLWGLTQEDMIEREMEIIVIVDAIDELTSHNFQGKEVNLLPISQKKI